MSTPSIEATGLDERSRTGILSPEALDLLAELHSRFGAHRRESPERCP